MSPCFPHDKIRPTYEHMHTALSSIKRGGIFQTGTRISVFYFETHYYESGRSKFHHTVFSCNRFTKGKSTIEREKTAYAKKHFPRKVILPVRNSTMEKS